MRLIAFIIGIVIATLGGVLLYRALYLDPRTTIVVTETAVREMPGTLRIASGALMLVGGASLAIYSAIRRRR